MTDIRYWFLLVVGVYCIGLIANALGGPLWLSCLGGGVWAFSHTCAYYWLTRPTRHD